MSCYKEILQKENNYEGWNPKKSAKHKLFKEGSEFQAGPSSSSKCTYAQNVNLLFSVLWKVKAIENFRQ
jgi:hypothetical protein